MNAFSWWILISDFCSQIIFISIFAMNNTAHCTLQSVSYTNSRLQAAWIWFWWGCLCIWQWSYQGGRQLSRYVQPVISALWHMPQNCKQELMLPGFLIFGTIIPVKLQGNLGQKRRESRVLHIDWVQSLCGRWYLEMIYFFETWPLVWVQSLCDDRPVTSGGTKALNNPSNFWMNHLKLLPEWFIWFQITPFKVKTFEPDGKFCHLFANTFG